MKLYMTQCHIFEYTTLYDVTRKEGVKMSTYLQQNLEDMLSNYEWIHGIYAYFNLTELNHFKLFENIQAIIREFCI